MHGCLNLKSFGALSHRGFSVSVYFGAFANFEVNTRTISTTTDFDANPQR
jgi:hypothetical protein